MTSPDPPAAPPKDQFLEAIDNVRGTAKWLIGAFAAVGAAIAGEGLLSDLGAASSGWLLVALVTGIVGLGAVATAVVKVADVLTPTRVSLHALLADAEVREAVDGEPVMFRGYAVDAAGFAVHFDAVASELVAARLAHATAPDASTTARVATATTAVQDLTPITEQIVRLGLYLTVSKAFADAKRWIVGAAVLAGVALTVFGAAGSSSSPEDPPAPAPAAAVPAMPAPVTVALSTETERRLRPLLKCQTAPLQGLAVGGDVAALDIIVTSPDCQPLRFTLTPDGGTAVQKNPPVVAKP